MINYTNLSQNISIYFKEIKNFGSLTREEEILLFTRIAAGDKSAETEVFKKMALLAVAVAKTYTCNSMLLEDLIQEANAGILMAIRKYDPALGFRFSSYARWWMKANISKYLNEMNIVHPTTNTRVICRAKRIAEKFYMENHREITEIELMDALEEAGEVVTDVTCLISIRTVRIDLPVDENDKAAKMDIGEFAERTASDNDYEEDIENEELASDVESLFSILTPRERILVKLKFGFTTGQEMTDAAVAKEWNKGHCEKEQLSQERIRQLVNGAIKKMRG